MTPMELPDPKAQHLQQRHLKTLMAIGKEIEAHKFPYPFYFSRAIDVDLDKMQLADQRSIRFDIYKNQTVLEITGNYYAAYAADRMDACGASEGDIRRRSLFPSCKPRRRTFPMTRNSPHSPSRFRTMFGRKS